MASIYSTKFGAGTRSGSTNASIFTVPAGNVAIVRSTQLYEYSGAAATAGVTDGAGARAASVDVAAVPGGISIDSRAVFTAGEDIYVFTTDGDWTFYVSGYLLTP